MSAAAVPRANQSETQVRNKPLRYLYREISRLTGRHRPAMACPSRGRPMGLVPTGGPAWRGPEPAWLQVSPEWNGSDEHAR